MQKVREIWTKKSQAELGSFMGRRYTMFATCSDLGRLYKNIIVLKQAENCTMVNLTYMLMKNLKGDMSSSKSGK